MPNIVLKIPKGSFHEDCRAALVAKLNDAAAAIEEMPDDPAKRFLCWVQIEEIETASWTCGARDVNSKFIPCFMTVYVPAGVLDDAKRRQYPVRLHAALQDSLATSEDRKLLTSIVITEVADGSWGVNGSSWHLPDFTVASGYAHLQHLVRAA